MSDEKKRDRALQRRVRERQAKTGESTKPRGGS
jgi:hypothetical protein